MNKDVLELGGRIIYEFRAHPKRAPWETASPDTRAAYRSRMQEIVNALSSAGYDIERRDETPPKAPERPAARPARKAAPASKARRRR